MINRGGETSHRRLRIHIRLISILRACEQIGLDPTPLRIVHTIAYFTDALAPIWNIPVLESNVLKKADIPTNPEIQADLDDLVGKALVIPSSVRYISVRDRGRQIDAMYALNHGLSDRIIDGLLRDEEFARELRFTEEVTLALAGLGISGMNVAVHADATYSDPLLDVGSIISLAGDHPTKTFEVSQKFATMMGSERSLSDAELTHLYIRHLYKLVGVGAGGR